MKKARVLISVSDKTGIAEFAGALSGLGYEIISTGGTFSHLREAGIDVVEVSSITNFPEMLDGRVKTLHPMIHGGILAIRSEQKHMEKLVEHGIVPIDIVVNNLYPFKKTILKENVKLEDAIENIDIGGPSMLRAAAKNYTDVTVIIDPSDYDAVLNELIEYGKTKPETRIAQIGRASCRERV